MGEENVYEDVLFFYPLVFPQAGGILAWMMHIVVWA